MFSTRFGKIVCNHSPVLLMDHKDSGIDSKCQNDIYYQNAGCESDFMFSVLLVGDFGILLKT